MQEKTKAELEWLKLQQTKLRSKGEDDLMPHLHSRRRGLLKRLKAEQAEIRRLLLAHHEASRERRAMLVEHKEISQLQQSASRYRSKLKKHSPHGITDQLSLSPSPAPSDQVSGWVATGTHRTWLGTASPSASASHVCPSPPLPQAEEHSSHLPTPSPSLTHTLHTDPDEQEPPSVPIATEPSDTTPKTDSHVLQQLRRLASHDK